jgi:cell division protein ZipA
MPTSFLVFIIVCLLGYILKMKWEFSRRLRNTASLETTTKKAAETVGYIKPQTTTTQQSSSINTEDTEDVVNSDCVNKASAVKASVKKQKVEPAVSKEKVSQSRPVKQGAPKVTRYYDSVTNDKVKVKTNKKEKDLFISLYLQAPEDNVYTGYELLQAILSTGLRYGEHSIFHFFDGNSAQGLPLFSLSSAISPGTFDLPNMGGFSTKALSFIMNVSKLDDPLAVFEKMLHVASQLREGLGGILLSAQCEELTKEHVRESCMKINSYIQNKNNLDLFDQMEVTI